MQQLNLVWGVIWLIQAFAFFAAGVIVGLVAFKVRSWRRPPSRSADRVTSSATRLPFPVAGLCGAAARGLGPLPRGPRVERRAAAAADIVVHACVRRSDRRYLAPAVVGVRGGCRVGHRVAAYYVSRYDDTIRTLYSACNGLNFLLFDALYENSIARSG